MPSTKRNQRRVIRNGPVVKIKLLHNEVKNCNLCQLSDQMLHKVFKFVNIRQLNKIRSISKRLCTAGDAFIIHEFKKALHSWQKFNPVGRETATLQSLKQVTEVYVKSDPKLQSTYCSCFIATVGNSSQDPYAPETCQVRQFLIHFFNMADEVIGGTRCQLLYSMTLLKLLKRFSRVTMSSSLVMQVVWRVKVELKGPWLGVLWAPKPGLLEYTAKRSNLLVLLSEMLIADITGVAFENVSDCFGDVVYAFGNDTSNKKRLPKTVFTLTARGSKSIYSLLRLCLEEDPCEFTCPSKWPEEKFTINLDIKCTEAVKRGYHPPHRIQI